jgi:hypothetical protein
MIVDLVLYIYYSSGTKKMAQGVVTRTSKSVLFKVK